MRTLRDHGDDVEADLARFYGIDYRDRWRRLPDGSRALTLRMILVRVERLPPESVLATRTRTGPHWSLEAVLAAHNWQAITRSKKPHPMLAKATRAARAQPSTPERERKIRAARARARARRRRLAAKGGG